MIRGWCLALGLAAFTSPALAQQVVIYRCTDSAGNMTVQNDEPCPKGAREQRQVVTTPPPLPAVFEPPETPELYTPPVRIVPRQGAATQAPEPQPPPALFQCSTWDQLHYYSEEAMPQQHCAPLQVVGLDGVSRPEASACQMVDDQCTEVATENLCLAWKRRIDEAEFRWRFPGADADGSRRVEYERLKATYETSNCAAPNSQP
ncbi:MAG: DUF4124 domain-containing protein [Pseudomonadota bacterium]|nr:DUF4124 domain-containing protein [Pseudomonadota bacterium]